MSENRSQRSENINDITIEEAQQRRTQGHEAKCSLIQKQQEVNHDVVSEESPRKQMQRSATSQSAAAPFEKAGAESSSGQKKLTSNDMSVVMNRISQLAELFTPEQSDRDHDEDEYQEGILEPLIRKHEEYDGDLLWSCQAKENQLVVQSSESIRNTIEMAADHFMIYFGEALAEIRDLRADLGEAEWTNRELKIAVKEKSMQVKLLIKRI